jgi:hypothetical protein
MRGHSLGVAGITGFVAVLLTGCSDQEHSTGQEPPEYGPMDEAYSAVDAALGCESDPAGQPIVPVLNVQLTSEQKLSAEHVQLDI